MNPNEFLELFEKEINYNINNNLPELSMYYKFTKKDGLYVWRKNYLLQRLEYVYSNIVLRAEENMNVWDVGCGYGTTCIFLAMNGIKSIGTTLEDYHKLIPGRKQFWQNYGNIELFEIRVENLYEVAYQESYFDYILVQDTLHHLEPIDQALQILRKILKTDGKIVVVDDNGNNIMQRAKLYLYRGNKRVIKFYDGNLKKHILFGNENVRSFKKWDKIFGGNGLNISGVDYIRFFPPYLMNAKNSVKLTNLEKNIWKRSKIFKEFFYWGLNFVANKK